MEGHFRQAAVALVALLVAGCGGGPSTAPKPSPSASAAPEPGVLRIGVEGGQDALVNLPLKVGLDQGYFRDERLSPVFAAAGGDVVAGSYEQVLRAQARGQAVEMIAVFTDYPGLVIEVGRKHQDQVRSIRDLVGHPVGVSGLGSPGDEMIRWLQQQAGLPTDSVPAVAAGSGTAALNLLTSDSIWALVATDPLAGEAEGKDGAHPIYDTRTPAGAAAIWAGAWPASGFYVTLDFARANPRLVQSLARVAVRALNNLKAHPPAQIFSPDGTMPGDGPGNVLATLKVADPQTDWSKVDLKKTYDNAYVKRVKA